MELENFMREKFNIPLKAEDAEVRNIDPPAPPVIPKETSDNPDKPEEEKTDPE